MACDADCVAAGLRNRPGHVDRSIAAASRRLGQLVPDRVEHRDRNGRTVAPARFLDSNRDPQRGSLGTPKGARLEIFPILCRRDVEVGRAFEDLRCAAPPDFIGPVETSQAVTNVTVPVVVRRQPDRDMPLRIRPLIVGVAGVIVQMDVGSEIGLHGQRTPDVLIHTAESFASL